MGLDILFFSAILAMVLNSGMTSDGSQCSCKCESRLHICDDLRGLRTEVDVNTADRRKWNRHFLFVQKFHNSWEDEIASVLREQMKNMPGKGKEFQMSDPKFAEMEKTILKLQKQNDQLIFRMSDVESRSESKLKEEIEKRKEMEEILKTIFKLQKQNDQLMLRVKSVESRSESKLKEEIEKRKDMETEMSTKQSQILRLLERRFRGLENLTEKLQRDLEQEIETRNQMKKEVEQMLPTGRVFNPTTYTRHITEFQSTFNGFGQRLQALEDQGLMQGYEIHKEQNDIKKLQSSIAKMQSVALKAADALRPLVPSGVADNFTKELNVSLDVSEDGTKDSNVTMPYSADATGRSQSNPYVEISTKLEGLQADMKVLTDSMAKAMSNIKFLENQYKDAIRIQSVTEKPKRRRPSTELVVPHQRPGHRPFNPHRDP